MSTTFPSAKAYWGGGGGGGLYPGGGGLITGGIFSFEIWGAYIGGGGAYIQDSMVYQNLKNLKILAWDPPPPIALRTVYKVKDYFYILKN